MVKVEIVDNKVIVGGKVPDTVIQDVFMPIKKTGLSIPKSVVMTSRYDVGENTTIFMFVVATNVVEDIAGHAHPNLLKYVAAEAITQFADALIAIYDGNTPSQLAQDVNYDAPPPPGGFAHA
jgi:hypothetical protein